MKKEYDDFCLRMGPCLNVSGAFSVAAGEREFVRLDCHVPLEARSPSNASTAAPGRIRLGDKVYKYLRLNNTKRYLYRNLHAFVPFKPGVEQRCSKHPRTPDQVIIALASSLTIRGI